MLNLFSYFSPIQNDAAYPWQIGFQDGATPSFEGIVELHDSIFFYLIVISSFSILNVRISPTSL